MKADFNYDEFPGRFAHCLNEKCVRRDTCLRHQVWLRVPSTRGGVYIINPGYLASLTGKSVLSSCSTNRSGSPEA